MKKHSKKTAQKKLPPSLVSLDTDLFKLGKRTEILNHLNWPANVKQSFLKGWHSKNPKLPKVSYPKHDFEEQKQKLKQIARDANSKHPLFKMVRKTAQSYYKSLSMVEASGTKRFFKFSCELYGVPEDPLYSSSVSTIKAANRFLRSIKGFDLESISPPELACILPVTVANEIRQAADTTFEPGTVKVITSLKLKSKAAASAKRIRVRDGSCFTKNDIKQLIQHELLVHSLTVLNGRKQPLKVLGLNTPRTTSSQEGLAVFAEFITNSIDVIRLRRICARVAAIQMAIDGADFIQVFKFFLTQGQSEEESYYSAARVFRGGNVKGRIVFTKDHLYLKGFIRVHRFFLNALRDKNFLHPQYFISGRMDCDDVCELEPYFEQNLLILPGYEPEWISDRSTLLAFLLSSSIMSDLGLSKVKK